MATDEPTLAETRHYVEVLFKDIPDKSGKPYAEHCIRVGDRIPPDAPVAERHAALLHDVIEDCEVTSDHLRQLGYSERTIQLVEKLSRPRDGSTYQEWIESIAATGDRGLIRIKLADNLDNSDPARVAALPPEHRSKADRYARARVTLENALMLLHKMTPEEIEAQRQSFARHNVATGDPRFD